MNMVKVYNKNGKHVDSFRKPQSKAVHITTGINYAQTIKQLNSLGYYVRSQFSHSGKTLVRSY